MQGNCGQEKNQHRCLRRKWKPFPRMLSALSVAVIWLSKSGPETAVVIE